MRIDLYASIYGSLFLAKCPTFQTIRLTSFEQLTFFCRAIDIFDSSVEQAQCDQMDLKQLTQRQIK